MAKENTIMENTITENTATENTMETATTDNAVDESKKEAVTEETTAEKPVEKHIKTSVDKTAEEKKEATAANTASVWEFDFHEDDIPSRRFFSSRKEDMNFLRDKWILSRISDEDLMEYLRLEQKRNDQLQHARDIREKRIMTVFILTIVLIAAVFIIYLLKDNPTLLTNVIYICAILGAFLLWKNPREKFKL